MAYRYLQAGRVVPGDPQDQVVPAPHAAQAAPIGKGDGGAQGSRAPVCHSQPWELGV